ncbi:CHAD domain-containing protein [Gramella sp. GC03-9]|uniref:CHAD domain-containing protein n=1 Tax=Christiangramia oceanisediminis TaxID=2920386 RepID=A0A9X2I5I7_9FLAO|nr:CHAD domain-containing protein [Gramella oceanisediminis]MCP9199787.1 CHAD domain-containing protein [Gramella oceanisediminis]
MAYKLEKEKNLKKNITEVAAEELQGCLDALDQMNVHEAVHDIRKRLKKLRALARLVRDELGEDNYKSINIYFRDLGRELSDLRDLTAHIETVGILRERYGDHLYVNFFNSIIKKIETERDEMEKQLKEENFFDIHLPEKLKHAQKELVKWPIENNEINIILPSIRRVYKRGRKAMLKAFDEPGKEIYHEWRKRVKYLWYQILLLQESWPEIFSTMEAEVHLLADYLGDDHDLMVLRDKLGKEQDYLEDDTQKELINAVVNQYSEHLRNEAHLKGKLIYAEEPDDFEKRMSSYISAGWE